MTDKTELPGLPEPYAWAQEIDYLDATSVSIKQKKPDPDEEVMARSNKFAACATAVRTMPLYTADQVRQLLATRAPGAVAEAPAGWRVSRITRPARDGDRWEVYSPNDYGGIVTVDEIRSWTVRNLLDALTAAPAPAEAKPAEGGGVTEEMVERAFASMPDNSNATRRQLRAALEAALRGGA